MMNFKAAGLYFTNDVGSSNRSYKLLLGVRETFSDCVTFKCRPRPGLLGV